MTGIQAADADRMSRCGPGGGGLMGVLHELERGLRLAAVEELIRLIAAPHFGALRPWQIRSLGEYDWIEIEGERFFERAYSRGKEAASALALAQQLGAERVLDDLRRLHTSLVAAVSPRPRAA
jgi:hypothetical protein